MQLVAGYVAEKGKDPQEGDLARLCSMYNKGVLAVEGHGDEYRLYSTISEDELFSKEHAKKHSSRPPGIGPARDEAKVLLPDTEGWSEVKEPEVRDETGGPRGDAKMDLDSWRALAVLVTLLINMVIIGTLLWARWRPSPNLIEYGVILVVAVVGTIICAAVCGLVVKGVNAVIYRLWGWEYDPEWVYSLAVGAVAILYVLGAFLWFRPELCRAGLVECGTIQADFEHFGAIHSDWNIGGGARASQNKGSRPGGAGTEVLRLKNLADAYADASERCARYAYDGWASHREANGYTISGWGRGDGKVAPAVHVGDEPAFSSDSPVMWKGTCSESWQEFSIRAPTNPKYLHLCVRPLPSNDPIGQFVEFDDVTTAIVHH
jgi:hypothetical protein